MKKLIASLSASLLLTACAQGTRADLRMHLENPLYAEQYYDELVDNMVNMELQNDPLVKDPAMKELIEETRVEALRLSNEADEKQNKGLIGTIMSDFGYAQGEALLLDSTLYLSATFSTIPGPELHVYLTTVVDPRDGTFPDETAIDAGMIQNVYGDQSYELPEGEQTENVRTFVLWDARLKRMYGFAQLRAM